MSYLLIVDDDEDFATAVATVLRGKGHEVHMELDLSAAVRSMTERRPDLLLLDVMFPEDSTGGFELARAMRWRYETLKDIPILMLTAVNTRFPLGFSEKDIDDDWMPVTEFLEKPVDLDVLAERVDTILAGRQGRAGPERLVPGGRRPDQQGRFRPGESLYGRLRKKAPKDPFLYCGDGLYVGVICQNRSGCDQRKRGGPKGVSGCGSQGKSHGPPRSHEAG